MIALKLPEVKDSMESLLLKDTFDSFNFIEGSITTFTTFSIDGTLQKDYFDEKEGLLSHPTWKQIRTYCHTLIKGSRPPLRFKFILALSTENTAKLMQKELPHIKVEDIQGFYLNFIYENKALHCYTGFSYKTFQLDKSAEKVWDEIAPKYLKQKQLEVEVL